MSSKPDAGVNHKEFGVTSEGVHVFLEAALRDTLGVDPKVDPFTVKLTGGPDGDVAGRVEIDRRAGTSGPNFSNFELGHIEVDSADFWTNRLLSASSRSTTEKSGPNRPIARTLKSR